MIVALALLALQIPCDPNGPQQAMNTCAREDFQRADAELNRIYRQAIEWARAADRELDRNYDQRPGYEETLREAQRAWVIFRDAHCTWEGYGEARGGSMEPLVFEGCRAGLTRSRITELSQSPLADAARPQ